MNESALWQWLAIHAGQYHHGIKGYWCRVNPEALRLLDGSDTMSSHRTVDAYFEFETPDVPIRYLGTNSHDDLRYIAWSQLAQRRDLHPVEGLHDADRLRAWASNPAVQAAGRCMPHAHCLALHPEYFMSLYNYFRDCFHGNTQPRIIPATTYSQLVAYHDITPAGKHIVHATPRHNVQLFIELGCYNDAVTIIITVNHLIRAWMPWLDISANETQDHILLDMMAEHWSLS